MAKSIVRGGQLHLHNLRMIRQVLGTGLLLSFLGAFALFSFKIYKEVPLYQVQQYLDSYKAHVLLVFRSPRQQRRLHITWHNSRGETQRVPALEVVRSPYVKTLKRHLTETFYKSAKASSVVFSGILSSLLVYWIVKGKFRFRRKTLRGNKLVSPWVLKTLLHLKRKASDLKIKGIPLLKGSEKQHILASGTTGSGKTNLFHELVPQIMRRGDRGIIVDVTGDYVKRYYKVSRGDILLNPFDSRSVGWDIFSECDKSYEFDTFARALIPQRGGFTDAYWEEAAAKIISCAFQIAQESSLTIPEIYEILVQSPLKTYGAFFKRTDAAALTDPLGEKTTLSLRMTLANKVMFLKHLNEREQMFSFRKWVQDENDSRWVFLTATEDQLETLKPLLVAGLDTTISTLLSLSPDLNRRFWMVLDELPSLQKIPSLQAGLSKGRKYGLCVFAGIQSMAQFQELYGLQGAKTILDLFNTLAVFRSLNPETCAYFSKVLGEQEREEARESLSYGAHAMRDGISINTSETKKEIVLPTEISQLKDLEFYLRLPGNVPLTKLRMGYNN